MRKYTQATKARNQRWDKKNLDRISFAVKKDCGLKERLCHAAQNAGQSLTAYIVQAVRERMEREQAAMESVEAEVEAKRATSEGNQTQDGNCQDTQKSP